jgi:LemA protein
MKRSSLILIGAVAAMLPLTGCGYNDLQRLDEATNSTWSEVLNQYQRRADLVPAIVATVKAQANFEQTILTQVTEARAQATSIQAAPDLLANPAAFQKFQQAQGQLSTALTRLMVVSENYPTLHTDQAFQDLRVTLEGTENRIAVARGRYIQAVQAYNVLTRTFPSNLTAKAFKYLPKPNFSVTNEAQLAEPPKMDMGGRR